MTADILATAREVLRLDGEMLHPHDKAQSIARRAPDLARFALLVERATGGRIDSRSAPPDASDLRAWADGYNAALDEVRRDLGLPPVTPGRGEG